MTAWEVFDLELEALRGDDPRPRRRREGREARARAEATRTPVHEDRASTLGGGWQLLNLRGSTRAVTVCPPMPKACRRAGLELADVADGGSGRESS